MKYGSDIPGARKILEALLETHLDLEQADMIEQALGKMHRSLPARHTPVRNTLTPEMKAEIKRLAETTDLSSGQIAAAVKCNTGRVSEVLHGRR